ncbi:MAG TPA: flagellar FlbD family protein [Acidothermaceae bacterium]|jgi:flagellar protein FlbD
MIVLTRLNGPSFALNPDLIERVEANPDTVVVLIGGAKYPIAESVEELLERVRDYRGRVIASAHAAEFPPAQLPSSDSSPSSERVLRILPTPGSE